MSAPISPSRISIAATLVAVVCSAAASYGADAQSLYQQAVAMQRTDGKIDLKAAQDLFEKAAAAGSAMAMQRLGDMYHDGDGGVVKDFTKAIEWYQKEATLDNSRPGTGALGMVALSEMYDHGTGVPQDRKIGGEWYAKALKSGQIGATKGDNSAMIAVAYCLATGREDIKPDPVNAWQWAIKSSEKPNAWAYELMASMYSQGIGVPKDESRALQNMHQAAQMGVSQDMLNVSLCYVNGIGVKKDVPVAVEWVNKAVERGSGRAMAVLGKYYHEGIGLERSDVTARDWYQKAIDLGDASALGYMGDLSIAPGVNPRDALSAMIWYKKGADAGDASSMFQLAQLLVFDQQIPHDVPRAVELLMQSSNMGFGDSMAMMGELYLPTPDRGPVLSPGTDSDALFWFRKAADVGSPAGMRDLGEMLARQADGKNAYSSDDDDKPLMAQAFGWLQRAASAGDLAAVADIGDAYLFGKGVNPSAATAITWYKKAADLGYLRAMRDLGNIFKENRILTDYTEAKKWYERGAGIHAEPTFAEVRSATGDPACMSGLAEMYDRAMGVQENNPLAYALYSRAAELNDGGGFRGIGQFLQDGQLLQQNLPQAAAYYNKAAERGDVRAMEALGRMFELGQGVEKNMDRAMELFVKARDLGSLSAWNWVFSHAATDALATQPGGRSRSGRGGEFGPVTGPTVLPLIAPLPSTQPATEPSRMTNNGANILSVPGVNVGSVGGPGGPGGPVGPGGPGGGGPGGGGGGRGGGGGGGRGGGGGGGGRGG